MCTGTHPFIPVPDTARVRMVYLSNGSVVMNVFYWKGDAPLIAADLSGLVDEVHTAWVANIKPRIINTTTLQYIEATALDTEPGPQVTATYNEAGGNTGTAAPNNVTLAIKFASGLTGRSSHGRMYWIGFSTSQISGDTVNPTTAAAMVTAVSTFFDAVETAVGLTHQIVSYCHAGAWRTTGVTTPVLSYLVTDDNLDSQRRRLAGRGM